MKKNLAVVAIWILTVYIFKENGLLSLDLVALKEYIAANQEYAMLIFIGVWVVRLFAFIPGVPLMIVGGICFGPVQGFILSMVGMAISETLVYVVSKALSSNKFNLFLERKNPQLKALLMKHNYKFLALGIICPIAPSDVICFMSASIGIHYRTYILTVIISNIPIMMLFSFLGITMGESLLGVILILLSAAIILVLTIKIWTNLKQEPCNS
ncbi:TVP38/TMEM64 family protein [Bacillus sp. B-jedd]|uniref:TVP38/TMEM64 family protein n=1 Tax=Bacillus sp. B-jedd TaxID=1476857 RepID=UPI000515710B|nr:VTT domain-containing protein [Bacillus sp. B-jedd]CEG27086.1 SNARE associated Golgi protein-like protein [Bacillus sp. B-jedd]